MPETGSTHGLGGGGLGGRFKIDGPGSSKPPAHTSDDESTTLAPAPGPGCAAGPGSRVTIRDLALPMG